MQTEADRPDLFEFIEGCWYPVPGAEREGKAWFERRERDARKAIKAKEKAAAALKHAAEKDARGVANASPTAVLRSLQVGQSFTFGAYRHTSQLSAVVCRQQAILRATFEAKTKYVMNESGSLEPCAVIVTRTA